jgi:hypothetical protein
MFLQDIIFRREKKRCKVDQGKVQVQDRYLEETVCLKLASYLKEWICEDVPKCGFPILSMGKQYVSLH